MGTPSLQHIAKGLMSDDDTGKQFSSRCSGVEIANNSEDEPRYVGEKGSIVAKIRSQSLRNGKHKLSMW